VASLKLSTINAKAAAAVHEVLAKLNFQRDVEFMSDAALKRIGLHLNGIEFPFVDVTIQHSKPLRLRLNCGDWDDLPPSIALLNEAADPYSLPMPGDIFHPGPHPNTGKPFICMRGTREYHTHPSHINETWEQYRGKDGMNLMGIVLQIAHVWRIRVK
jgi:hypothetical protein